MFSKKRLQDKYHSWKKLFLQNWTLFRASRIGVVGLAIMIAFLLIALAAPFMGLRDPLYWLAPESDTISVAEWWQLEVKPGSPLVGVEGPVNHTIAVRVSPSGQDSRADRIYVPQENRILAVDTGDGSLSWTTPCARIGGCTFDADSRISTDPVVVNYGLTTDPMQSAFRLFFGTENGTVYVLQDPFIGVGLGGIGIGSTVVPGAGQVRAANFGEKITGLAALTIDDLARVEDRDSFVVGTESGHVYAFTINRNATFRGSPFYAELWNTTLTAAPVHIAGAVRPTNEGIPTSSPAFYYSNIVTSRYGEAVYVGTGDGWVYGLWMSNGTVRWPPAQIGSGAPWDSAPVVAPAAEIKPSTPTLVYAATKDLTTGATKLFVFEADTGAALDTWEAASTSVDHGIPIVWKGATDPGTPNTPTVYGASIFITTTTGWLYSVNRDPIHGLNNRIVFDAGSVAWATRDSVFLRNDSWKVSITSPASIWTALRFVVVASNFNNGTATPADDFGVIEVYNLATGELQWKKSFRYSITATPVTWKDAGLNHVYPSLWFGTSRGDLYSYSIAGTYLAPLPPSWTRSTPYPSNNYYVLGTDARGRDIFSQLLWGSRVALLVGFASAFFSISIGVIIGLVAGYLGGRVESVLMRFTDVILVIPGLPLVIILAAVLGAGIGNIILVIAIVGWPGVARVIRAEVLSLKERPFIDSARVTGASNVRIMFRHVAPNVAPLAFLYMTFAVSSAILTEAALSFIGLGDVNTISWGIMLQDVSQSKALTAWWWLLPPGLAITMISLAFFLVGRAFDEIVNPRLRKR